MKKRNVFLLAMCIASMCSLGLRAQSIDTKGTLEREISGTGVVFAELIYTDTKNGYIDAAFGISATEEGSLSGWTNYAAGIKMTTGMALQVHNGGFQDVGVTITSGKKFQVWFDLDAANKNFDLRVQQGAGQTPTDKTAQAFRTYTAGTSLKSYYAPRNANSDGFQVKYITAGTALTAVGDLPDEYKTDATLESIMIGGVAIEGFNPAQTTYTIDLPYTKSVDLSVETTRGLATATGDGVIDVSVENPTATIVITAADGSTEKTYTVNFNVKPNLMAGWDGNQELEKTPAECGWTASDETLTWQAELATSSTSSTIAAYRKVAFNSVDEFLFYAPGAKDGAVITYAYPVELEAGKIYSFSGSNWRRNGQGSDVSNVTFAISTTADKTGIITSQTQKCNTANLFSYSFNFVAETTGTHYFIRYAESTTTSYQDGSTNLILTEVVASELTSKSNIVGLSTAQSLNIEGNFTVASIADLVTKLGSNSAITSIKLGSVASDAASLFSSINPNCLVYLPEGATAPTAWTKNIVTGTTAATSIQLIDGHPFSCPVAVTGADVTYTRNCYTDGGWESIILPFNGTCDKGGEYTIEKYKDYGNRVAKFETGDDAFVANQAYIMKHTTGTGAALETQECTFTGTDVTLSTTAQPAEGLIGVYSSVAGKVGDVNKYILDPTGESFYKGSENSTVPAFRAYFMPPVGSSDAPQRFSIDHNGNGATGINATDANEEAVKVRKILTREGVRIIVGDKMFGMGGAVVE